MNIFGATSDHKKSHPILGVRARHTTAFVVVALIIGGGGVAHAGPTTAAAAETTDTYNNVAFTNKLAEFTADSHKLTAELKKSAPETSTIAALSTAASEAVEESKAAAGSDEALRLGMFGSYMNDAERDAIEAAAISNASEHLVAAEAAVTAWKDEAAAETKRIAERAAAAKAAAAAAAAKASVWGAWAGGSETPYERLRRIADTLPWNFTFTLGQCGAASSLACYQPGPDTIIMDTSVLSYGDCKIRGTFAHEYRHRMQSYQGLIKYGDGGITNRDWLEADAVSFGWGYTC